MKQRIVLVVSLLFAFCLSPALAAAQTPYIAAAGEASKQAACETIGAINADTSCGDDGSESGSNLTDLIANILQILSLVAGVIAVIMIIIGGLKFITASGDANGIKSARNTLIYAVVGLVIVLMAQIIVHFVLGKATG